MVFGDLKSASGIKALNDFLANASYLEGYGPSQADTAAFESLSGPPKCDSPHALRWYNHIKSYGKDISSFPGVHKSLDDGSAKAPSKPAADDDFDLFGDDDEEDEEAEKLKAERVAAYAAKKSTKAPLIAKSSIVLDVKPWDDETDLGEMEKLVRSITADGLLWGASKLVPLAYGIRKLQISCVVEDDKIGTDFLEEEITKFENSVQSVDIAAFNKI